jgi:hypothetical protein
MGGHAAWRKRVAAGDLAKGSGGAALRHRPRFGRKGSDLALNRLGNIGGRANPKRKATKISATANPDTACTTTDPSFLGLFKRQECFRTKWIAVLLIFICGVIIAMYALVFVYKYQQK